MKLCRHRVNRSQELREIAKSLGVEIDLRDHDNRIVLAHDPWTDGESFAEYLKDIGDRFVIANVKSEGVEVRALEELGRAGVRDFFFLDLSFPALVKMADRGERRSATRYSVYEPREAVRAQAALVSWVWADFFRGQGIDEKTLEEFQSWGLKVCLVSPELVGGGEDEIRRYAASFKTAKPDMVCTKRPELWSATSF